ncbi:MAG: cellulose-binding protein [Dactylosporangium sp.]|nr:cellulose binding domain-containing protein [Dactylosporangium sp.]NNJ60784.1 cellulose-binding protein [Dactylosporangium sp.]
MRITRHRSRLLAAAVAVGTAGAALTTVVAAHAASGCGVTYAVTSQWSTGFGASVTVNNLGDPVTSWQLTWSFTAGQTITQLWNGSVAQTDAQVTVTNAGWNGSIGTGASVDFGFNATAAGDANPVPTDFALNGLACTGAATSSSASASGSASTSPSASQSASADPSSSSSSSVDVLTQVSTPGRVQAYGTAVQYTWPGVYFEGRFRGTGVGITLNDHENDYVVEVDGTTVATLVTPGQTTYWVEGLAEGDHTVRLAKRTESAWSAGEFDGLVAADGGEILSPPAARSRQIEFIGDSWTAGYGNMSTSHDCSATGGVTRNSNADVTFGALAARGLDADYQVLAMSGMGMVRNYGGQSAGTDFRTYYDQTLQAYYDSTVWENPGTWNPQVVVVGLGINDFSTSLTSGEQWTTMDELVADYTAAYLDFLDQLRDQYGADTHIVLTYPDLSYQTTALAESVQAIADTRNAAGDDRVGALYYDNSALGLDLLGCDWHPSENDHQLLADALTGYLATISLDW